MKPMEWNHLRILHKVDGASVGRGGRRLCPRLTNNHLDLNNASKMRVRLATQVRRHFG